MGKRITLFENELLAFLKDDDTYDSDEEVDAERLI